MRGSVKEHKHGKRQTEDPVLALVGDPTKRTIYQVDRLNPLYAASGESGGEESDRNGNIQDRKLHLAYNKDYLTEVHLSCNKANLCLRTSENCNFKTPSQSRDSYSRQNSRSSGKSQVSSATPLSEDEQQRRQKKLQQPKGVSERGYVTAFFHGKTGREELVVSMNLDYVTDIKFYGRKKGSLGMSLISPEPSAFPKTCGVHMAQVSVHHNDYNASVSSVSSLSRFSERSFLEESLSDLAGQGYFLRSQKNPPMEPDSIVTDKLLKMTSYGDGASVTETDEERSGRGSKTPVINESDLAALSRALAMRRPLQRNNTQSFQRAERTTVTVKERQTEQATLIIQNALASLAKMFRDLSYGKDTLRVGKRRKYDQVRDSPTPILRSNSVDERTSRTSPTYYTIEDSGTEHLSKGSLKTEQARVQKEPDLRTNRITHHSLSAGIIADPRMIQHNNGLSSQRMYGSTNKYGITIVNETKDYKEMSIPVPQTPYFLPSAGVYAGRKSGIRLHPFQGPRREPLVDFTLDSVDRKSLLRQMRSMKRLRSVFAVILVLIGIGVFVGLIVGAYAYFTGRKYHSQYG